MSVQRELLHCLATERTAYRLWHRQDRLYERFGGRACSAALRTFSDRGMVQHEYLTATDGKTDIGCWRLTDAALRTYELAKDLRLT